MSKKKINVKRLGLKKKFKRRADWKAYRAVEAFKIAEEIRNQVKGINVTVVKPERL